MKSSNKKKMSTGRKLAIGAGVVGAGLLGAKYLRRGKSIIDPPNIPPNNILGLRKMPVRKRPVRKLDPLTNAFPPTSSPAKLKKAKLVVAKESRKAGLAKQLRGLKATREERNLVGADIRRMTRMNAGNF